MAELIDQATGAGSAIPADDLRRQLTIARPDDDARLTHLSIAGGTYTILVTGEQTAGRYCLIDMLVPPGGGPPPHRHDFEEMFSVLAGTIEATFRGEAETVRTGETINIPANAPHVFKTISHTPARLLCLCSPAGQEKLFIEVGDPVESRIAPAPKLTRAEKQERAAKAQALAGKYRTEFVKP
jgi:quercetin dioxygenase-like cupin family protein